MGENKKRIIFLVKMFILHFQIYITVKRARAVNSRVFNDQTYTIENKI